MSGKRAGKEAGPCQSVAGWSRGRSVGTKTSSPPFPRRKTAAAKCPLWAGQTWGKRASIQIRQSFEYSTLVPNWQSDDRCVRNVFMHRGLRWVWLRLIVLPLRMPHKKCDIDVMRLGLLRILQTATVFCRRATSELFSTAASAALYRRSMPFRPFIRAFQLRDLARFARWIPQIVMGIGVPVTME